MFRIAACLAAAVGTLTLAQPAWAQEISARDRQSAGEAYDRGTAAYLAEDFARAGQWFETAHRLAPASAALIQAVRSYERAGNAQRAATLALRLESLYPDDRAAQRTARQALRGSEQFFRVEVDCGDCAVEVDGAIMGQSSFFLSPDADHEVVGSFDTGSRRETVRGAAGETRSLAFEAPPAPEPEPEVEPDVEPEPLNGTTPATPPQDDGIGVIPVPVTIGAIAVTAVVGAVLIWSGIDTLDGVPAYEAMPTPEGLAAGQSREERTNWLIGGTALAGAVTLVLAVLTDWGGGGDASSDETGDQTSDQARVEVSPSVGVQEDGGMLGLRGTF